MTQRIWLRGAYGYCLIIPVDEDALTHLVEAAKGAAYVMGSIVHGYVCQKCRFSERELVIYACDVGTGIRLGALTPPTCGVCYHSLFAHVLPHDLQEETVRQNLLDTLGPEEVDQLLERIRPYTVAKLWQLKEWLASPRDREIGMPPQNCLYCDNWVVPCHFHSI